MAIGIPNMELLKEVHTKLASEGMLNDSVIVSIVASPVEKKELTSFIMFQKKREMNKTIATLS